MNLLSIILLVNFVTFSDISVDIEDSVYQIDEVIIEDYRLIRDDETLITSVTDKSQSEGLTDILKESAPLYIRDYGTGGMATMSVRGMSSSHTLVQWNGIPLNMPMHGLFDLSLFPAFFADEVYLESNSNISGNNTNALGGGIDIINRPDTGLGIGGQLTQNSGSFGRSMTNGQLSFGSKKLHLKTRIHFGKSENDFTYKNITKTGEPVEKLENAQSNRSALLQEIYWQYDSVSLLSARLLVYENNNSIPAPMTVAVNDESQYDKGIIALLNWNKLINNLLLDITTAFLKNSILYENQMANISAASGVNSGILNFQAVYKFNNKSLVYTGLRQSYHNAFADGYENNIYRLETLFSGGYMFSLFKKVNIDIRIQKLMYENRFSPFLSALKINSHLYSFKNLELDMGLGISRNYRLPNLNDMYWVPGGNPDLKGEEQLASELSLITRVHNSSKKFNLKSKTTVFASLTDNWIMWVPGTSGFWSPFNIDKVFSRGIESELKIKYIFSKNIETNINTGFTYHKTTFAEDGALWSGNQLIYIPNTRWTLGVGLTVYKWDIFFRQEFTAKRFINNDNTTWLPAFSLSDMGVRYSLFKDKNYNLKLSLRVNNLTNSSYQQIAWRPMPGRNYLAGLTFEF